jgi:hypothetical protein
VDNKIRNKTIQVKVNEKQKKDIELFVSKASWKDNVRYSISTYLLDVILEHIKNNESS